MRGRVALSTPLWNRPSLRPSENSDFDSEIHNILWLTCTLPPICSVSFDLNVTFRTTCPCLALQRLPLPHHDTRAGHAVPSFSASLCRSPGRRRRETTLPLGPRARKAPNRYFGRPCSSTSGMGIAIPSKAFGATTGMLDIIHTSDDIVDHIPHTTRNVVRGECG